ncbi:MAG: 4Fe-4S binding protein, partial [Treponema sp.]|nr:4Fe-4S binding protein [Treponema sp.]
GSSKKKTAFLRCNGARGTAKDKASYIGIKSCRAAVLTAGGIKSCAFGCTGFGDCVQACTFGALSMGENGLPSVDEKKCTGCGKCVRSCPKHLFVLIDEDTKGSIARCSCMSENKAQIRKDCTAGCFKCGLCAKKCPEGCIDVSGGIPQIDYSKCTSCGECVAACPDKVLIIR